VRIAGLVLCGGRSRRFGSEKALAQLAGEPLIAHVAEVLAHGCERVAVNAPLGGEVASWAGRRGMEVKPDAEGSCYGPLCGVLAGLRWARAEGIGMLITAPCDVPWLPPDFVARLAGAIGDSAGTVAVDAKGDVQPLCALWRIETRRDLAEALKQEHHPPARRLVCDLGFEAVQFGDPRAFLNVNTPADLHAARAAS